VRRATLLSLTALAVSIAGCGDDSKQATRVKGDTLTVYASLPAHGPEGTKGRSAEAGMRRALADAKGRVAGRNVRLVALPSTRPGDQTWDPGTVEANAERAVDDPTAIAYIGELDQGGSAVSLPVTNDNQLLQLSPADGLTSLTRRPPGRPRAGPERYYPDGDRSFVRLVPPDIGAAREVVRFLGERGSRRLVVLHGDRIADRELEGMILALVGTGEPREVTRIDVREDDPEHVADVLEETVAAQPDAVVYAGAASPEANAVLAALGARLSDVPLWGGPQLVPASGFVRTPNEACALTGVPTLSAVPARGRRLLRELRRELGRKVSVDALLGYDAMRLALDAIEDGGADRRQVLKAARRSGERVGVSGTYAIGSRGDAEGRSVVCAELDGAPR